MTIPQNLVFLSFCPLQTPLFCKSHIAISFVNDCLQIRVSGLCCTIAVRSPTNYTVVSNYVGLAMQ